MSRETLDYLNSGNVLVGFTAAEHNESYAGAAPWWSNGTGVGDDGRPNLFDAAVPFERVIELMDVDLREGTVESSVVDGDGFIKVVDPTRKTIVRVQDGIGTTLGVFKSGYQIHGYNKWLVDNVQDVVKDDLQIKSAGLLAGGAQAWVQIVADQREVEGVKYYPLITASSSCDGSIASQYRRNAQVVVCDNTLAAALGEGGSVVKFKHTKNSGVRVMEVRDALGIINSIDEDFENEVKFLTGTKVSEAEWEAFVNAYAPLDPKSTPRAQTFAETKRDALDLLWSKDGRVSPWRGTAYGVLAAVNTYQTHEAIVRGADRAERNAERIVKGTWDDVDTEAVRLLAKVTSSKSLASV